jgi:hypothetical protein
MNEMELLWELAQDTPLPEPAQLDTARARLVAAIAADPAVTETAYLPYSASGSRVERRQLPAPASVLSGVRLMYGGAIGAAVQLIIAAAYVGDVKAYRLKVLGHHLTTAQLSHLRPLIIMLVIALGLGVIALWLWMARANGQGRNWARILSTVLFGLATLELIGNHGVGQVFWAMLTWLTGLAAVCQLWRPVSSAYYKAARALGSRPPSQISGR